MTHRLKTTDVEFSYVTFSCEKASQDDRGPSFSLYHFVLLSSMTACIQYVCIYVDTCAHMVKETKEGREGLTPMLSHDLHNMHRGTHRRCVFWSRSQSLSKVLVKQGSDAQGQIWATGLIFFFLLVYLLIFLNSLQTMEMLTEIIDKNILKVLSLQ